MKKLIIITSFVGLLVLIYYLGPRPAGIKENGIINISNEDLRTIEARIAQIERNYTVKDDNDAEIIWYDSAYVKTPCSIIYLHGFSASKKEGDPVHRKLAEKFGCNMYLARLSHHGIIEEEPMLDLTADKLIESAKEAVEVGAALGERLIVMGTSTGGTLALYLAAHNPEIDALVLYSPNIRVANPAASILNDPWGLQIARLINNSKYHQWPLDSIRSKYWINRYRYEALTQLQQLLEETMVTETFQKVTQPVFMAYYYKSEEEQDNTVSVQAMLHMFENLKTAEGEKVKVAFPEAGHHVIASDLTSGDWIGVMEHTEDFLKNIGLKPVNINPQDSTRLYH